ncbi:MAG: hypothetical protein KDM63_08355 [Verrucomicrobiae bacterium]|nr:hypothetical protein [Verrucomicrobiae bacterium]
MIWWLFPVIGSIFRAGSECGFQDLSTIKMDAIQTLKIQLFSQLLENSAPENPEISLKVPSPLDPDSNPRFPPQDTISWCEGNSLAQYIVAGQAFFSARPQDMGAIFGPKSFGNLNIKHLRELNFFRGDFGPKSRPSVNPKPKKKCHLAVSPEAAGPATRKEVGIVQSSP